MPKRIRSKIEKQVDQEFEAKTKEELLAEFDQSQALHVPAKKRESKLISIRLPMVMIKKLRELAIEKGDVGYQQLIKIFIADGLVKSKLEASWFASVLLPQCKSEDWNNFGSSFSLYEESDLLESKLYFRPRWSEQSNKPRTRSANIYGRRFRIFS